MKRKTQILRKSGKNALCEISYDEEERANIKKIKKERTL